MKEEEEEKEWHQGMMLFFLGSSEALPFLFLLGNRKEQLEEAEKSLETLEIGLPSRVLRGNHSLSSLAL
ncbi:hypothetical protein COCNU_01G016300 [Cocos nucifera]|uniref:Uncharacterized protein n=1 Tax=Cocos nucifera TaxID=13894 RepID=A0A8K0HVY8_COCNU|nr:hypothetical protein COCNU_01G016300 [Cocos nucifera]